MTDSASSPNQPHKSNGNDEVPSLTYFNIRGVCQPIRHILYYLNVAYQNIRVARKEEEKQKQGKGEANSDNLFDSSLPIFEDSILKISNCIAIALHVCNRYAGTQLLGNCLRTRAKVNEIMFKYSVDMNKIMPSVMDIVLKSANLEGNNRKLYIQQSLRKLVSQSKFISHCIKQHTKTAGWVLGTLTIVDFYFAETCFYICGFFTSTVSESQEFSGFLSFLKLFQTLGLAEVEKNKKEDVGVFLQFKNEKMKEIVTQTWAGDKQLLFV